MADYAALLSSFEPRIWRNRVKVRGYVPLHSHLRPAKRKYFHGSCKVVWLSTWKSCGAGPLNLRAVPCLKPNFLSVCMGSLVDPDGATTADWLFLSDQLLLMGSIFLTYMAGVIPLQKPNLTRQKIVLDDSVVPDSSTSSVPRRMMTSSN